MKQGVRTSALVLEGDRLLLVREVEPTTGEEYWVPPGGGLEADDESVFSSVQREALEEAGIRIDVGRLVYLREFRDSVRGTRWLELYFLASRPGPSRPATVDVAPELRREARWFTRAELQDLVVYPDALKNDFWEATREGLDGVRYLGSSEG